MEGLVSLLLFAGLFYVMMRFGCGAHKVHGHGTQKKTEVEKDIDPVCGMDVGLTQGYGKMHNEKLYRFCSRVCLDKFETDPAQYIHPNHNPNHNHGGKPS